MDIQSELEIHLITTKVSTLWRPILASNSSDYKPNFFQNVCHGMKELKVLCQLSSKEDFIVVDMQLILNLVMDVFLSWMEFT